jgi:hypothetical protein
VIGLSNTSRTARDSALDPVQHGEDRPSGVQAPLAQPDQQVPDQGRVLRTALDQREGLLGAVNADAQGHYTQVLGEADAVDHHRNQVQARQVGAHELGERLFGGGDEPAGDPERLVEAAVAATWSPTGSSPSS